MGPLNNSEAISSSSTENVLDDEQTVCMDKMQNRDDDSIDNPTTCSHMSSLSSYSTSATYTDALKTDVCPTKLTAGDVALLTNIEAGAHQHRSQKSISSVLPIKSDDVKSYTELPSRFYSQPQISQKK